MFLAESPAVGMFSTGLDSATTKLLCERAFSQLSACKVHSILDEAEPHSFRCEDMGTNIIVTSVRTEKPWYVEIAQAGIGAVRGKPDADVLSALVSILESLDQLMLEPTKGLRITTRAGKVLSQSVVESVLAARARAVQALEMA